MEKDVHWRWSSEHDNALKTLLKTIPSGRVVCYDIKKPLFVTADASKDGLGFVLSHDQDQSEIV